MSFSGSTGHRLLSRRLRALRWAATPVQRAVLMVPLVAAVSAPLQSPVAAPRANQLWRLVGN